MDLVEQIWQGSGLYQLTLGQLIMVGVCLVLLYLGIVRKFEPLLLVTIGFGGILSNIPGVEIATGDGLLHLLYVVGIETGAFPLIIFMGVGALTDFGPLLANPSFSRRSRSVRHIRDLARRARPDGLGGDGFLAS
jgi:oxaloacetate decarboxylase beta subunit